MPWLCDNMAGDLEKALGGANNSEFIFDPDGKIVVLRDWSSPRQLRADLEKLVGPVEKATSVADLKLSDKVPAPAAARGIVPRLDVPEGLQSIKVRPQSPCEGQASQSTLFQTAGKGRRGTPQNRQRQALPELPSGSGLQGALE
ncbi:MAG: hypothetical protein ACJA1W_001917 [Akkermansiaceae bacterium]|jgi:hypothetical protein